MTYRPDIDGLRAIAVLAVILFHLNSSWLPGGFLGVDIFFVISGYLIGGILYRELSTGTFSLKRFYLRRMRRILPAFFAVVIIGVLVGMFLIIPGSNESIALKRTALASVFFAGNLFCAINAGYFTAYAEMQPLNHLWSLAVEEQFYLIYPLILWALLRIIKKINYQNSILILLSILFIFIISSFSLAFLPIHFRGSVMVAYYLPHLRFGELLIGACYGIWVNRIIINTQSENNITTNKSQPANHFYNKRSLLEIISVCLLLGTLILPFPTKLPWFPGFSAIIPCLATVGIMHCGLNSACSISRFLSHPIIVYIGKLSYSLYLWHWPVLAFARYILQRPLDTTQLFYCMLVILFLSVVSYYTIEYPLRHKQWTFTKTFSIYYLVPATITIILWFVVPYKNTMEPYTVCGAPNYTTEQYQNMIIGDSSKKANVLIAGDSYTIHLLGFVQKVAKHEGWSAKFSGIHGSPFLLDYVLPKFHADKDIKKMVSSRNSQLISQLRDYKTVILSSNWSEYMDDTPTFMTEIDRTLDYLTSHGHHTIMVFSAPNLETSRLPETFARLQGFSLPVHFTEQEIKGKAYHEDIAIRKHLMQHIKTKFPKVVCINLLPLVPKDIMVEGKSVMRDNYHFSFFGAQYVADQFIQRGYHLIAS